MLWTYHKYYTLGVYTQIEKLISGEGRKKWRGGNLKV
jgi:hypothetical protein